MSQKDELRRRIEAKRKRIEARLAEMDADAQQGAREQSKKLRAKLDELSDNLRGGWEDLTEAGAEKLNRWLADDGD